MVQLVIVSRGWARVEVFSPDGQTVNPADFQFNWKSARLRADGKAYLVEAKEVNS